MEDALMEYRCKAADFGQKGWNRALLLSRAKYKSVTSRTTAAWLQAWRNTISCQETKQAESELDRGKERLYV